MKGEHPYSTTDIIDYVIAFQLEKMERYNDNVNREYHRINRSTEAALSNLIRLIQIRKSIENRAEDE